MAEDRIDKNIKSKLEHHETPMDVASFWADLAPKIERKKKDRRGFIWFLFIPLFLGLIGLVYFNWDLSPEENNVATVENYKENTNESISTESDPINKSKEQTTLAKSKLDENTIEKSNTINTESIPKIQSPNSLNNGLNQNQNASTKTIVKNEKTTSNNNTRNKRTSKSNNSNTSPDSDSETKLNSPIYTNVFLDENLKEDSKKASKDATTIAGETKKQRTAFDIALLDLELSELSWKRSLNLSPVFVQEMEEEKSDLPKWNFGLSGFASYGKFTRNLESKDDSISSALRLARDSKESLLESFGGGVIYELKHRTGFYGTIGMTYTRLNERYINNVISSEIETKDNVETGIKITQDTVAYFSTAKVLVSYSTEQIRYNSLQFLDLPLSLAYRKDIQNFDVSLELGAQLNLLTYYKGTIASESELGYSLQNDAQSYFKKSTGIAWNSDVVLGYNLNSEFRLWTGFSYLNRRSSVTNSQYGLNQFYTQKRLKLGLQIKW